MTLEGLSKSDEREVRLRSLYDVVNGVEQYEAGTFATTLMIAKQDYAENEQPQIIRIGEAMRRLVAEPSELNLFRCWNVAKKEKTPDGYVGLFRGLVLVEELPDVVPGVYRDITRAAMRTHPDDYLTCKTARTFAGRVPELSDLAAELGERVKATKERMTASNVSE